MITLLFEQMIKDLFTMRILKFISLALAATLVSSVNVNSTAAQTATVKVPNCLQVQGTIRQFIPCDGVVPIDTQTGNALNWNDLFQSIVAPADPTIVNANAPSAKAVSVQNSDGAKLATATNQTTANTSLAAIATNTTGGATASNQVTANTTLGAIATNTTGLATAAGQTAMTAAIQSTLTTKTTKSTLGTLAAGANFDATAYNNVDLWIYGLGSGDSISVSVSPDGTLGFVPITGVGADFTTSASITAPGRYTFNGNGVLKFTKTGTASTVTVYAKGTN